jgi:hypothetical protein
MSSRNWLLMLAVLPLIAACTSNPSPLPVVPSALSSAAPSSSPGIFVDCGPLAQDDCTKAVAVAEGTFPTGHPPFSAVRIANPSAVETCPPSGGPLYVPPSGGPPSNQHSCAVIATVTTSNGDVAVGLIRFGDGWIWSAMIT